MNFAVYVTDSPATYSADTPTVEQQIATITGYGLSRGHKMDVEPIVDVDPELRWEARPKLMAALALLKDKQVGAIMTYSLGTLGLSSHGVLSVVGAIAADGGHLAAVADGIDSTTPQGVIAVRALYFASRCVPSRLRRKGTLSERPKKARYVPFGWRLGATTGAWQRSVGQMDVEPVRNPIEQVLLQEILEQCDGTGAAAYKLSKRLNAEGRLHPRLKKPWKAGNIMSIYATACRYMQDAHIEMGRLATMRHEQGLSE